jgi:carbon-monoxide dehydrogenase large subunit
MDDFKDLAFTKNSVGQSVSRFEDPELLKGEGTYTDDVKSEGDTFQAFAYRSPYAHAKILNINISDAINQPGVLEIITHKDMDNSNIGPIPCLTADKLKGKDGNGIKVPPLVSLAKDKLYYVGQPIAFIVADTLNNAKNAADFIILDIDELDVIVDPKEAMKADMSPIHPSLENNIAIDWDYGDKDDIDNIIEKAKYKTSIELRNSRLIVSAMEPRACMASYDNESSSFSLHSPSQGLFGFSNILANIFGVERDQMHCHTPSVGGSFGMKSSPYPEYIAALVAAKKTGKTIKWKDTRTDSFLSDTHGRDSWIYATIAFDENKKMLGAKIDVVANSGAFMGLMGPMAQSANIKNNFCGAYDLPSMYVNSKAVYTNTTPIGAYRGAGRPEGVYIMERLLQKAAIDMDIDPVELRKINLIRKEQFPYKSAAGLTYDSGDFQSVIEDGLETADWYGFESRKEESAKNGFIRGRALTYYLEVTAPVGKEMGRIRFDDNGAITLISGNLDYGQGHLTSFAQIMSDKLSIPMDKFKLLQGDSKELIAGTGTGGSRTAISGGTLLLKAANIVIENGKQLAAHLFGDDANNVEFNDGNFEVPNTNHKINILDLSSDIKDLIRDKKLPANLPQGLDGELAEDTPPSSFPNGCHISEVEINPKTGEVKLIKHVAVNDFGNLVNPLLVEGQVLGGIIQAQGQILMENLCYDDYGQLLSGSYMDYTMPKAADIPKQFIFKSHPVPCKTNPLGIKGCGEAGISGALPTIMNAIVDALESNGIEGKNLNMPVTSEKMWEIVS